MKKIFVLLTFLILVGICIPAVSAAVLDEELTEYRDMGSSYSKNFGSSMSGGDTYKYFRFKEISQYTYVAYIIFDYYDTPNQPIANPPYEVGVTETTYTICGETKPARVHTQEFKNIFGIRTGWRMIIFPQNWDVSGHFGDEKMSLAGWTLQSGFWSNTVVPTDTPFWFGTASNQYTTVYKYKTTVAANKQWHNRIIVSDYDSQTYKVDLIRDYDNASYASTLNLLKDGNIELSDVDGHDFTTYQPKRLLDTVQIISGYQTYNKSLTYTADPDNTTVTVYVRNSQTFALLADAHIVINASVNNEFYEVINQTLPSGTYTGNLQPTGGGLPNPDFYRLIPTVEGYNSIMPYIDFEVDGTTIIYAYLEPIGGAPENENNTFIDFYVRDMSSNPISGATVKFGRYTLITNSAGYTIFEVDKNENYSWTVSKSGYGSVTGNAVIGADPRHTINTVLAPAVTPTKPTPIPTSTPISPTPTMTAPTGEPVSNWLEWFAAHFGMILGGGVEIGKIFMWLCFSVPVGVYVGKEAKAGAAGFMAGAGVVTLFFVLIGWVPIWLLVLVALIIGLLYAKVFNNSDSGGGR